MDKKLNVIVYVGLVVCAIVFFKNSVVSTFLAIVLCGIQQLRIIAAKERTQHAECQATLYRDLIFKQLIRKWKGDSTDVKHSTTYGKTL